MPGILPEPVKVDKSIANVLKNTKKSNNFELKLQKNKNSKPYELTIISTLRTYTVSFHFMQ